MTVGDVVSRAAPRARFWSIRGRLVAGFGVLVALHALAGFLGRRSMIES